MLTDFTEKLTAPDLVWDGGKHAVHGQFENDLLGIRDGLYIFLFRNAADGHVRDSNKPPKLVIRGQAASLKPGKFESGLIDRLRNYHQHLRRDHEDGSTRQVFAECLKMAIVLDLSKVDMGVPSTARVFERYWTEHIDSFLQQRGLVAKSWNKRAEWRDLDWPRFDAVAEAELRRLADTLALKIARMAAAHALP